MKGNARRLARKQMLLFTLGSSFLFESCKTTASKKTTAIPGKVLGAVHVPAGTISKPPDGIIPVRQKSEVNIPMDSFVARRLPYNQSMPDHLLIYTKT